jgi:hypothetical protein
MRRRRWTCSRRVGGLFAASKGPWPGPVIGIAIPRPVRRFVVGVDEDGSFLDRPEPRYGPLRWTLEEAVENLGIETQPRELPPRT